MVNFYDIAYGLGIGAAAPLWLMRPQTRRKVRSAFQLRMGHGIAAADPARPGVLIHAVSLGEMNATRLLVRKLAQARPNLRFIITTTTTTGWNRGRQLYADDPRITLIRYPLDFSSAIARLLDAVRPAVVVLMELEVWPNFILQCRRRKIPVLLVNGRMTAGSFAHYRWGGPVVRRMFRRLEGICAQEQAYADRFIALGASPGRVQVTGTMKFDTAEVAERVEGDEILAAAMGLHPDERLWVCGSTGEGEELILLRLYRRLLKDFPSLRLALVPRHPERFDGVAQLIADEGFSVIRRSQSMSAPALRPDPASSAPPILLGDTMGELRSFYSLGQIIFVGRTLLDLSPRQHGSDMIEPAALGRPVLLGPYTGNFAEPMRAFLEAGAMIQVSDVDHLHQSLHELLSHPDRAAALGRRAQSVVRAHQGSTDRHVRLILQSLPEASPLSTASAAGR